MKAVWTDGELEINEKGYCIILKLGLEHAEPPENNFVKIESPFFLSFHSWDPQVSQPEVNKLSFSTFGNRAIKIQARPGVFRSLDQKLEKHTRNRLFWHFAFIPILLVKKTHASIFLFLSYCTYPCIKVLLLIIPRNTLVSHQKIVLSWRNKIRK